MSGVSGDFPVQLAARSPVLVGLLPCIVLPVCLCQIVCRVVLQIPRPRHPDDLLRGHVASVLVRRAQFPRGMLAISSRG